MNVAPGRLAHIAAAAEAVREALGDDEDMRAFLDTVEGLTDAMEIADALLMGEQDDEDAMDACDRRIAEIEARREGHKRRRAAKRTAMLSLLRALGVTTLKRPLGTMSRRAGKASVEIYDEADLPSQLWTVKTTWSPDKASIHRLLDQDERIPGARLVIGPESLSVRTK